MTTRRQSSPCGHKTPLDGLSYVAAGEAAEKLLSEGWRQTRCGACGLYAIWLDPEASPEGLAALAFVQEIGLDDSEARADHYTAFYAGWAAAKADEETAMTCSTCGHRHCDKSGALGCAFCGCGHPASCKCSGCFAKKFLDPDEEIDVGDDLKPHLTPGELAEIDQLLASRHDLARGLMGSGKTGLVMQRAMWTVDRLAALLRTAVERRDG